MGTGDVPQSRRVDRESLATATKCDQVYRANFAGEFRQRGMAVKLYEK